MTIECIDCGVRCLVVLTQECVCAFQNKKKCHIKQHIKNSMREEVKNVHCHHSSQKLGVNQIFRSQNNLLIPKSSLSSFGRLTISSVLKTKSKISLSTFPTLSPHLLTLHT